MTVLSSRDIQRIIPHRYPFLLVDRIVDLDEGKRAVGIKAVTIDEPFFQGHFPSYPVMPGVLIAEALAQVGAVAVLQDSRFVGRIPFLAGLDGFRFKRQVVPGDLLRLEVTLSRVGSRAGKGHGVATVDGQMAAEGDIMFVLSDALDTQIEYTAGVFNRGRDHVLSNAAGRRGGTPSTAPEFLGR